MVSFRLASTIQAHKTSVRWTSDAGKFVCRFHGGLSTGPKTELGRQICAAAKTIHGDDSRLDREINRITMQRLRLYALILGVPFRSDASDKRL